MNKKLFQIDNLLHFPLKTLEAIRDNQYRSKDGSQDYCPFSVEERIAELSSKQALRLMQQEDKQEFDQQLSALMQSVNPHRWLLSMIDYFFKTNKGQKMREFDLFKNGKHVSRIYYTLDTDNFPLLKEYYTYDMLFGDWKQISLNELTINEHDYLIKQIREGIA